jgi:hypothetical protein
LHSKICGQSLPLNEKTQKIVALQIQLLQEYATAYWYVLKHGPKKLGNRAFGKQVPTYIQRIIRLLGKILITHYLECKSEPTWIWMDIHSLFNVLPDKICETAKIKEHSVSGEITTTIADTYKQIIALSSADPYGMYDREILRVNHYLSQWTPDIKLEKTAPGQIPLGYFVSMDNDKGPSWADIDIDLDEDSDVYQIFLDDMIKTMLSKANMVKSNLGRYFSATAFPVANNSFDPDLLKHMQRQWEGRPPRQQVHFDNCLHVNVAIGLQATSQALKKADNQTIPGVFRTEVTTGNNLKCTLKTGSQVAIGSLVGYKKLDEGDQRFGLGLVSRMTMPTADNAVQFELKNISSTVRPVNIELIADDRQLPSNKQADQADPEHISVAALSYRKRDSNQGEHHFLIVESRCFKVKVTVIVSESGRSYGALLLKQSNLGLGYVVIEYHRVQEVKQLEAIPTMGYDFL